MSKLSFCRFLKKFYFSFFSGLYVFWEKTSKTPEKVEKTSTKPNCSTHNASRRWGLNRKDRQKNFDQNSSKEQKYRQKRHRTTTCRTFSWTEKRVDKGNKNLRQTRTRKCVKCLNENQQLMLPTIITSNTNNASCV